MLRQFTLPEEEQPSSKDKSVRMGQLTIELLKESFSIKHPLGLKERAILAKLCLATINGKATPVKQICRELAVKTRQATSLANSLKQALKTRRKNGHPLLRTGSVRFAKNRTKRGYYLDVVQPSDEKQHCGMAEAETSISEIVEIITEIHQNLLHQIRTAGEKKEAMPMEDTERQAVLDTIEDIRAEIEKILAATSHGLIEDKKKVIGILFKSSERSEAIMPSVIAEKIGKSVEETIEILDQLGWTLRRSPVINLAVKSQRNPQKSRSFGYYIAQKQKSQKSPEKPALPASAEPLDEDKKQTLMQLIDRAIKQTRPRALRAITILKALKMASASDAQITPAYCQYVAYQLFGETYPERNFEEKLLVMQEIPEDRFGFRIERTGPETWQATPSTNQEVLRPILTEMAEQDDAAETKNPAELKQRVQAGLKHLKVKDRAFLQAVFDVLTRAYTAKQGLSQGEIAEKSRPGSEVQIARFIARVQAINRELPNLLGFNVVAEAAERYSLKLTDNYVPAEIEFFGYSAPTPVTIEKDANFNKDAFNKILASPKNREAMRIAKRTRIALDIFASHSENKEAISAPYLENETSKSAKPGTKRGRDLIQTIKNLLARLKDGKMTLNSYNMRTWYLSIDEPATETPTETQETKQPKQQAAPAPRQTKPRQAKTKPPKPFKPIEESEFIDAEEGFVSVVEERPNPNAGRLRLVVNDDYSHLPATPLMEFQKKITAVAVKLLDPDTATLRSLTSLRESITGLDTKGQSQLVKAQKDYLEKLDRVRQRAKREIDEALRQNPMADNSVPRHLTTQLYSA